MAVSLAVAGGQPAAAATPTEYINAYAPSAQTTQAQYQVPASVVLAQSIHESGWGTSTLTERHRNFFGIKCVSPDDPGPIAISCHRYPTQECDPSGCHTVNQYFRGYASSTDSFRDYGRLLRTSSRYAPAFQYVNDPDQFIREVHRAGYATDPDYANKIIRLMQTHNLYRFNRPSLAGESVDGDRFDDLMAVDPAGVMWRYPGKAGGTFAGRVRVGPGWVTNYNRIAVGDSNGDGFADLHATATDGDLFYWRNRGDGTFSTRARVGEGWKSIEWFALADVNGDNRADILARDGGNMYLFLGRSDGGFATRSLVGSGWGAYPRHFAGDADGDGDADIWAVDAQGGLWFWRGNGRGGFTSAVDVGGGWGGFDPISVLDAGGDGKADIVAVRAPDDTLWRWPGRGDGGFLQGAQIGSGWDDYRIASY